MKPNFALDLSHEGINLLHRAKGGWSLVGSVALDDPDMGARLEDLRRTAAMLESGGFTCKLIIPNSQILYTTVEASGPDDISREVQIRSALDGLTPYPVGDLVFDWRAEGDKARVAVLARETMDEAEAFAVEYKFNPVSFVARPERRDFSGEPFFGKTKAANRILGPSTRVEPDASPVPRSPRALELSPDTRVAPESETPPATRSESPAAFDAPGPSPAPKPERETKRKSSGEAKRKKKDAAKAAGTADVSTAALAPFPPTIDDAGAPPQPLSKTTRPEGAEARPLEPDQDTDLPRARPRVTAPKAPEDPSTAPALGPLVVPDEAEVITPGAETADDSEGGRAAAFQTRRAPGDAAADEKPGARLSKMAARIALPENGDRDSAAPVGSAERRGATTPKTPRAKFSPIAPSRDARRLEAEPQATPDRVRADMAEALARPLPSPGQPVDQDKPATGLLGGLAATARGLLGRGSGQKPAPDRAQAEASPSAADTSASTAADDARAGTGLRGSAVEAKKAKPVETSKSADEADAFTVFGARKSQATQGRPKYLGLILTLLLLLAMAIVAVWSTFAINEDEPALFNPTPDEITPAAPVATPPQTAEPEPEPAPIETPPATEPPPTETAEVLSPELAETRYAATGVWQRAPEPLGDPQTTRLEAFDPMDLPAAPDWAPAPVPGELTGTVRDAMLANPMPPPPPGTSFDLDENGLVRATPEGALSPAGILVFAGRPAVAPPPRPGDLPDVAPPIALPDVPNTRPRPRPADLDTTPTPAVTPEVAPGTLPDATQDLPQIILPTGTLPGTDDDAALEPGLGDAETDEAGPTAVAAAPRPAPRPENLVVSTSTATAAIDAAVDTAVIEAAVEDAIDASIVDATELAVLVSRMPSHRPDNFAGIVDSAREAASDGSRVVAAAATTTPSIPTSANVATRATTKNAINLRDINLIGVYGTSNSRRALVRLKNGRYVKVQVGDRLDGGQVTSITATELTYQKGSRALRLAVLPLG